MSGTRDFSLLHTVQKTSEAHTVYYPMGIGCSFPGLKRPGFEADHSSPSSVKAKNVGAMPSFPNTSSRRGV
jgi:hypothetical protein